MTQDISNLPAEVCLHSSHVIQHHHRVNKVKIGVTNGDAGMLDHTNPGYSTGEDTGQL